ncbi:putative enhancer of rudimentary [Helianthus debilis subsp. tardiflorus]
MRNITYDIEDLYNFIDGLADLTLYTLLIRDEHLVPDYRVPVPNRTGIFGTSTGTNFLCFSVSVRYRTGTRTGTVLISTFN